MEKITFIVLLLIGIFSFVYVGISIEKSVNDNPLPAKGFYGYDGRLYTQQGELVAIHEPVMNRIRPATLSDKLFYGELK